MTTEIAERQHQWFSLADLGGGANDGTDNVIRGMRVFRSGTFTDMFGFESTWVPEDLAMMARNFTTLNDRNIFPNVPVRVDHGFSMRNVIGYFKAVYVDPNEPTFLKADLEITEPDELARWQRGTYRSRSIELGVYITNDKVEVAPVVYGVAFVDIPAVEGLFRQQPGSVPNPGASGSASATMGATEPTGGEMTKFRIKGIETEDVPSVQAHINDLESQVAQFGTNLAQRDAAVAEATTKLAAATTQIATLQAVIDGTVTAGRVAYVDALAVGDAPKITNVQKESFRALVSTMNDEQFASFKAAFDAAPANSLFAKHDTGATGGDGSGTQAQATFSTGGGAAGTPMPEKEVLTQVIQTFRRQGKDEAWIAQSEPGKKLAALTAAGA